MARNRWTIRLALAACLTAADVAPGQGGQPGHLAEPTAKGSTTGKSPAPAVAGHSDRGTDRCPGESGSGASLSLGWPAGGSLQGAVKVPAKGVGYQFLPFVQQRHTDFATEDMAGLLSRTARKLARRFPDAVLHLGNIGAKRGGPIPWSVSHQSGRDADIAFFVRDAKKPVRELRTLVRCDGRGRALSPPSAKNFRFDVERNWALVESLLSDSETQVQWIFIFEPLKQMLLDHARKSGASADSISRAESLLRQPSGSGAHDDHMHVRIYCSCEDRLLGCFNDEPFWPWIDTYAKAVAAHIAHLERTLDDSSDVSQRLEALEQLRAMRASQAAAGVARQLTATSKRLREATLEWLVDIAGVQAETAILAAVRKTKETAWALALVRALERIEARNAAALLEGILEQPQRRLTAADPHADLNPLRIAAATALGTCGRAESVPLLLSQLAAADPNLRQAADASLRLLTNRSFPGSWAASVRPKRLEAQRQRWLSWYATAQDKPRPEWLLEGFRRASVHLSSPLSNPANIPLLINAMASRKPYIRFNARKSLVQAVGDDELASRCNSAKPVHCWRVWWHRHGASRGYGASLSK